MIREIPYADHDEWLQIRKQYIGGSDAASVVGLSEYGSPYSLWAEKTGRTPPFEGNIATEVGSYLEDFVAKLFERETGKTVRRKNRTMVNDLYPYACANVDRVVVGEKAILEIKTTGSLPVMRKVKGGEYPDRWYCQMLHYLAVTGMEKAYLAVLVSNNAFRVFELDRDQAEIDALMEAERAFWQHVEDDAPPPMDGSEATTEALTTIYAESNGERVQLFGRETLLNEYIRLKGSQKELDNRIHEIENIIKGDLRESAVGDTGRFSVSWKPQERRTFQTKEFERAHPEIDLRPFYKTTSVRPFKVTEKN